MYDIVGCLIIPPSLLPLALAVQAKATRLAAATVIPLASRTALRIVTPSRRDWARTGPGRRSAAPKTTMTKRRACWHPAISGLAGGQRLDRLADVAAATNASVGDSLSARFGLAMILDLTSPEGIKSMITTLTAVGARHVPHLSYAVLRSWDLASVTVALGELNSGEPVEVTFDGIGLFRRGRAWLLAGVAADLITRQEHAVTAVTATGAELHKHYVPGRWLPHCSLAPRAPFGAAADSRRCGL